jgi:hypothetical protein
MLVQTLENKYGIKQLFIYMRIHRESYPKFSFTGNYKFASDYENSEQWLYLEVKFDERVYIKVLKKRQDYDLMDYIKSLYTKIYETGYYIQSRTMFVCEKNFTFEESSIKKDTWYKCNG